MKFTNRWTQGFRNRRPAGTIKLSQHDYSSISELQEIIQSAVNRFDTLPKRYELINAAASAIGATSYLEIGVGNPQDCFDRVAISRKTSVDPGVEYEPNPVDFRMTSDDFFALCNDGAAFPQRPSWDIVFIDGLHRASQVKRDIDHALAFLNRGGLIFLHDCLPPEESVAREMFNYRPGPKWYWCGDTWKAFFWYLQEGAYRAFVLDCDWGVGVIDTSKKAEKRPATNLFYCFDEYAALMADETWKRSAEWFLLEWSRKQSSLPRPR